MNDQKDMIKNSDFEKKTQLLIELIGSHYRTYKKANKEIKAKLIKIYVIELFVTTKKELQIAESPLLKSSKMLKNLFGTPDRSYIRTFCSLLEEIDFDSLSMILGGI